MQGVGTHLVLELWGCSNLNSKEVVERALRAIVAAIGVTLLDLRVYPFEPMGVTGVAIVAESHIMIHTWPEHGYAAIDVFTCGRERDLQAAIDTVREHFTPERIQAMNMVRGIVVG
ncbi:MAG: S-adenosylmethionine decarboxylase proenzyme [Candidatus Handelsmanbacteria bacterium RIFCSPLOWO2_12_FULL_64_10]|uniref:S-adenosylmethionine decarboxylase proenzyme n=1 Tax=Handelsmanbacteria sp. (strain RIFCSPLOWO2_12_FULL_64_10) TaxID=1817868 RepID=A0A1F6CGV5_HANXR|nr:MAG: S-adenosylmethionine decarboxylase proenzyme [Candidatus Handelsmanbacteria bacterium RIFCSPLOWO2_12_FULL_64_10]